MPIKLGMLLLNTKQDLTALLKSFKQENTAISPVKCSQRKLQTKFSEVKQIFGMAFVNGPKSLEFTEYCISIYSEEASSN